MQKTEKKKTIKDPKRKYEYEKWFQTEKEHVFENSKGEMKKYFQSKEEQLLQIEELLDQSHSEPGRCCCGNYCTISQVSHLDFLLRYISHYIACNPMLRDRYDA